MNVTIFRRPLIIITYGSSNITPGKVHALQIRYTGVLINVTMRTSLKFHALRTVFHENMQTKVHNVKQLTAVFM